MLKQSELNPDEQAQVFARADALFREETEREKMAQAAAKAAEELGVPQEYLDRAAAQIEAEKAAQILAQSEKRTQRRTLLAVAFALVPALLMGLLISLLKSAPQSAAVAQNAVPKEVVAEFLAPPTLNLTHQDDVTTVFRNEDSYSSTSDNLYKLEIKKFFGNAGTYQADHGFSIDGSLRAYSKVSFFIKSAGISNVQVDLQTDRTRWNSHPISLTPQGQRVTVNFADLERKVKSGATWTASPGARPDDARSLVFQFGSGVNPVETRGTVEISDVRFD